MICGKHGNGIFKLAVFFQIGHNLADHNVQGNNMCIITGEVYFGLFFQTIWNIIAKNNLVTIKTISVFLGCRMIRSVRYAVRNYYKKEIFRCLLLCQIV